jgi:hypothetical protein
MATLQTLERGLAARFHARAIGHEIGSAGCADRVALLTRWLLGGAGLQTK